jgi:hypothetical protein
MSRMLRMSAPSRTPAEDDLLTTAQVALLTDRTIATVNRWAVSGRLPTAAQANGRVFRRSDVNAFLVELAGEAEERARQLRERAS